MTDRKRTYDARQAILWARVSRRRLDAGTAIRAEGDPATALERYGEWLQGLQALHSAIAAVRSIVHGDASAGAPLERAELADLHLRVTEIRRLAATGLKRIQDPWAPGLRREGDAVVARDATRSERLSLAEWRHALDAIESWAQRVLRH